MGLLAYIHDDPTILSGPYLVLRLIAIITLISVPASLLWVVMDYLRILSLRRRMPPGPFPLPFVGNWFDIPKVKSWIRFEELSWKYKSPMVTLWNGRRPIIMCNDAWCISDLLEKRANIYSSRPHFVVLGDMANQTDSNQVCLVYGDRWRLHRRLTHSVIGSQAVRSHRGVQSDESKLLIRDLMQTPDNMVMAIERYSCSTVSIIGWGRRIDKMNDHVAQCALGFMQVVNYVIPFLFIMETLPILAQLPSWIYKLPSSLFNGALLFQKYFYDLAEEGSKAKENNFSKILMKTKDEQGLAHAEVAGLTANLIGGGVDTTSSSMLTFILAMCVNPKVQAKAQDELDRVIGTDRMPSWSDETSLPYVTALISEVLRWRSVTILGGLPHAPTQDDEYQGYHIPKGTAITGNLWGIHRNPRDYPEPDAFRPERFYQGLEKPHPSKKGHNAFGWGRRQCPGQPLAEQGLFITISRMLWSFRIEPGLDEHGNHVELDIFDYTDSENMRPSPFRARFTPRTQRHADVILENAREARERLRVYDGETKVAF